MLQSIWLIIEGFVGIYHTFVNFLMDEIYIYIYIFLQNKIGKLLKNVWWECFSL